MQKKVNLIGISGKIGAGKNHCAKVIQELTKVGEATFTCQSFAAAFKNITASMLDVPVEDLESEEVKNSIYSSSKNNLTVGEILQKMGQTFKQIYGDDVWVDHLMRKYDKERETCNWIITDVRFPNEAKAIKERGGVLIRMHGDPAYCRVNSKRDLNHISETALDQFTGFDAEIENTLKDDKALRSEVETVIQTLNIGLNL